MKPSINVALTNAQCIALIHAANTYMDDCTALDKIGSVKVNPALRNAVKRLKRVRVVPVSTSEGY